MMADQRNEILQAINGSGYYAYHIKDLNGTSVFHIYDERLEIRLKCTIPPNFPFEFPKFEIFREFVKNITPIPHVDKSNGICIFDNNIVFPNFDRPMEMLIECIHQAIKTIEEGINGKNKYDFIEEFLSYWNFDEITQNLDLIFDATDKPQRLFLYKDENNNYCASSSKDKLKNYFMHIRNTTFDILKIDQCLYLPIAENLTPPYPTTNKGYYLMVKSHSMFFEDYFAFLNNRTQQSLVIFSQMINGNYVLAGWLHKPFPAQPGFRKKSRNPELACLGPSKNTQVIKLNINQITNKRLFARGGDEVTLFKKKVTVIGCGSIGSYLIQTLAELGVSEFVLIDNQILTHENIARHFCGLEYVGKTKVEAIREKLIKHYGDIECDFQNNNALSMLREGADIFNSCDYNFLVVGNTPVDIAFIREFASENIKKPLIIMWVEPFVLGGHAIIIDSVDNIESKLFENDYSFKYPILENGKSFKKKEAGCQSTYMPYSGFEAKLFIDDFCDYIFHRVTNNIHGNVLYSWGGSLDWARKNGINISSEWLAKADRTINVMRL